MRSLLFQPLRIFLPKLQKLKLHKGRKFHLNDAQTRIATYSQWSDRKDYQAMLRTPEMRERNRVIHTMCRSFEPVMYEVSEAFDG